jgi:N-acetylneuraminic acid mutarotase
MGSKTKLTGVLVRMLVVASALALLLPGGAGYSARIEGGPEFAAGQTDGTALRNGVVTLGAVAGSLPAENEWTDMNPASHPAQRTGHAMAYDSDNGIMVLFGGEDGPGEFMNGTWSYNCSNNTWTLLFPENAPEGRSGASMAYDSALGLMVLFGGYGNVGGEDGGTGNGSSSDLGFYSDTWTYNVGTNEWTNITPANSPPPMEGSSMAYDSKSGLMVLFGGFDTQETWTFDLSNAAWTNMSPATSPPLVYVANGMAYDSGHDKVVIYGGENADTRERMNETWTYSLGDNNWTRMNPQTSPPGLAGHNLAYDSANGVVVLFGGSYRGEDTGDHESEATWIYDPDLNTWTDMTTSIHPANTNGVGGLRFAMCYDSQNQVTVLFGGEEVLTPAGVTYTYKLVRGQYEAEGVFTSAVIDTGASRDHDAYYGALEFEAAVPAVASLKFRARSGGSIEAVLALPFKGLDGTGNSYFDQSGQRLPSSLDRGRWIQYRAYLGTSNANATPVLRQVTIWYNLMQAIESFSIPEGDTVNGTRTINWTVSDPDNDTFTFIISLLNTDTDETTLLEGGLGDQARSWDWNTTDIPNGSYRLYIAAIDDNPYVPLTRYAVSGNFTISHPAPPLPPPVNREPEILNVIAPNNTVVNSTAPLILSAVASDPDGDLLTYDWQENGVSLSKERSFSYKFAPGDHTLILLIGDGRHITTRTFNFSVTAPPKTIDAKPAAVPGFEAGIAGAAVVVVVTFGLFWRRERR